MDGLETTRRHFQLHLHDDNRNEISGHNQDYEHQQQYDGDWSLESSTSHLVGDDFLVEDILDLGCIPEDLLDQQHPLDFGELEDEEKVDDDGEEDEYRSSKYKSFSRLPVDDANSSGTTVPVGDISDLEWVSQIVDDSVIDLVDIPSSAIISPPSHLLLSTTNSSKPHSSGSISNLKPTLTSFSDEVLVVPSKSRSKRASTGGHVWSTPHSHMAEPLCSSSVSSSSSCSSAFSLSSCVLLNPKTNNSDSILLPVVVPRRRGRGRPPLHKKDNAETQQQQQQKKKKKKGRKPKSLITTSEFSETSGVANGGANNFRRCSHCGVQKTPQWRAGPKGAKTLCNACGVRYKSGRLLPEYRPAMSPTFLDHVHSNSHRKVLEMRRRRSWNSNNFSSPIASPPPMPPTPFPSTTSQRLPDGVLSSETQIR